MVTTPALRGYRPRMEKPLPAMVAQLEDLLGSDDVPGATAAIFEWVYENPEDGEEALRLLLPLLNKADIASAPHVAMLCGALVERGAPATPLAEAMLKPTIALLEAADRLAQHIQTLPLPEEEEEDLFYFGLRCVAIADLAEFAGADPEAMAAFDALDKWYLPFVASVTRSPDLFRALRRPEHLEGQKLRELTERGGCSTSYFLGLLLHATNDDRFVVLLPEIEEGYSLQVDGVVETGQLSILLSDLLQESLRKIGASGPAEGAVLEVARGEGPQVIDASYDCKFYLYPWQALGLETGLPEDQRFVWKAPGGTGSRSLPADFQPSAIEPLDGARVVLLVGPTLDEQRSFARVLSAARMFERVAAKVSAERLSENDYGEWLGKLRAALSN